MRRAAVAVDRDCTLDRTGAVELRTCDSQENVAFSKEDLRLQLCICSKARLLCGSEEMTNIGEGAVRESVSETQSLNTDSAAARVPTSCTKAFDSLYYCYSPFYQGKVYYQTGELDDCRGRLKRFRMCVMSRFRSVEESEKLYEEVAHEETKDVPPLVWELREEYVEVLKSTEEAERNAMKNGGGEPDSSTAWWL